MVVQPNPEIANDEGDTNVEIANHVVGRGAFDLDLPHLPVARLDAKTSAICLADPSKRMTSYSVGRIDKSSSPLLAMSAVVIGAAYRCIKGYLSMFRASHRVAIPARNYAFFETIRTGSWTAILGLLAVPINTLKSQISIRNNRALIRQHNKMS